MIANRKPVSSSAKNYNSVKTLIHPCFFQSSNNQVRQKSDRKVKYDPRDFLHCLKIDYFDNIYLIANLHSNDE